MPIIQKKPLIVLDPTVYGGRFVWHVTWSLMDKYSKWFKTKKEAIRFARTIKEKDCNFMGVFITWYPKAGAVFYNNEVVGHKNCWTKYASIENNT